MHRTARMAVAVTKATAIVQMVLLERSVILKVCLFINLFQ